jgi:hypothetical protein
VDVDPAAGKVRFELPWRARMKASVNAATPIVVDDFVFVSASYGTGAVLLQIGTNGPKKIWDSDDALTNHYATSVYKDGFLYGACGGGSIGIPADLGREGLAAHHSRLPGDRQWANLSSQREDADVFESQVGRSGGIR